MGDEEDGPGSLKWSQNGRGRGGGNRGKRGFGGARGGRFDGPRFDGPRFDGPRFDGPRNRFDGPRQFNPRGRFDGPDGGRFMRPDFDPRFDGPDGPRFRPRGHGPDGDRFQGPDMRFNGPDGPRFNGPDGQRFPGPRGQGPDGPRFQNIPEGLKLRFPNKDQPRFQQPQEKPKVVGLMDLHFDAPPNMGGPGAKERPNNRHDRDFDDGENFNEDFEPPRNQRRPPFDDDGPGDMPNFNDGPRRQNEPPHGRDRPPFQRDDGQFNRDGPPAGNRFLDRMGFSGGDGGNNDRGNRFGSDDGDFSFGSGGNRGKNRFGNDQTNRMDKRDDRWQGESPEDPDYIPMDFGQGVENRKPPDEERLSQSMQNNRFASIFGSKDGCNRFTRDQPSPGMAGSPNFPQQGFRDRSSPGLPRFAGPQFGMGQAGGVDSPRMDSPVGPGANQGGVQPPHSMAGPRPDFVRAPGGHNQRMIRPAGQMFNQPQFSPSGEPLYDGRTKDELIKDVRQSENPGLTAKKLLSELGKKIDLKANKALVGELSKAVADRTEQLLSGMFDVEGGRNTPGRASPFASRGRGGEAYDPANPTQENRSQRRNSRVSSDSPGTKPSHDSPGAFGQDAPLRSILKRQSSMPEHGDTKRSRADVPMGVPPPNTSLPAPTFPLSQPPPLSGVSQNPGMATAPGQLSMASALGQPSMVSAPGQLPVSVLPGVTTTLQQTTAAGQVLPLTGVAAPGQPAPVVPGVLPPGFQPGQMPPIAPAQTQVTGQFATPPPGFVPGQPAPVLPPTQIKPGQAPPIPVPGQVPTLPIPGQPPPVLVPGQAPPVPVPGQVFDPTKPPPMFNAGVPPPIMAPVVAPPVGVPTVPPPVIPGAVSTTAVPGAVPTSIVPGILPTSAVPGALPTAGIPGVVPGHPAYAAYQPPPSVAAQPGVQPQTGVPVPTPTTAAVTAGNPSVAYDAYGYAYDATYEAEWAAWYAQYGHDYYTYWYGQNYEQSVSGAPATTATTTAAAATTAGKAQTTKADESGYVINEKGEKLAAPKTISDYLMKQGAQKTATGALVAKKIAPKISVKTPVVLASTLGKLADEEKTQSGVSKITFTINTNRRIVNPLDEDDDSNSPPEDQANDGQEDQAFVGPLMPDGAREGGEVKTENKTEAVAMSTEDRKLAQREAYETLTSVSEELARVKEAIFKSEQPKSKSQLLKLKELKNKFAKAKEKVLIAKGLLPAKVEKKEPEKAVEETKIEEAETKESEAEQPEEPDPEKELERTAAEELVAHIQAQKAAEEEVDEVKKKKEKKKTSKFEAIQIPEPAATPGEPQPLFMSLRQAQIKAAQIRAEQIKKRLQTEASTDTKSDEKTETDTTKPVKAVPKLPPPEEIEIKPKEAPLVRKESTPSPPRKPKKQKSKSRSTSRSRSRSPERAKQKKRRPKEESKPRRKRRDTSSESEPDPRKRAKKRPVTPPPRESSSESESARTYIKSFRRNKQRSRRGSPERIPPSPKEPSPPPRIREPSPEPVEFRRRSRRQRRSSSMEKKVKDKYRRRRRRASTESESESASYKSEQSEQSEEEFRPRTPEGEPEDSEPQEETVDDRNITRSDAEMESEEEIIGPRTPPEPEEQSEGEVGDYEEPEMEPEPEPEPEPLPLPDPRRERRRVREPLIVDPNRDPVRRRSESLSDPSSLSPDSDESPDKTKSPRGDPRQRDPRTRGPRDPRERPAEQHLHRSHSDDHHSDRSTSQQRRDDRQSPRVSAYSTSPRAGGDTRSVITMDKSPRIRAAIINDPKLNAHQRMQEREKRFSRTENVRKIAGHGTRTIILKKPVPEEPKEREESKQRVRDPRQVEKGEKVDSKSARRSDSQHAEKVSKQERLESRSETYIAERYARDKFRFASLPEKFDSPPVKERSKSPLLEKPKRHHRRRNKSISSDDGVSSISSIDDDQLMADDVPEVPEPPVAKKQEPKSEGELSSSDEDEQTAPESTEVAKGKEPDGLESISSEDSLNPEEIVLEEPTALPKSSKIKERRCSSKLEKNRSRSGSDDRSRHKDHHGARKSPAKSDDKLRSVHKTREKSSEKKRRTPEKASEKLRKTPEKASEKSLKTPEKGRKTSEVKSLKVDIAAAKDAQVSESTKPKTPDSEPEDGEVPESPVKAVKPKVVKSPARVPGTVIKREVTKRTEGGVTRTYVRKTVLVRRKTTKSTASPKPALISTATSEPKPEEPKNEEPGTENIMESEPEKEKKPDEKEEGELEDGELDDSPLKGLRKSTGSGIKSKGLEEGLRLSEKHKRNQKRENNEENDTEEEVSRSSPSPKLESVEPFDAPLPPEDGPPPMPPSPSPPPLPPSPVKTIALPLEAYPSRSKKAKRQELKSDPAKNKEPKQGTLSFEPPSIPAIPGASTVDAPHLKLVMNKPTAMAFPTAGGDYGAIALHAQAHAAMVNPDYTPPLFQQPPPALALPPADPNAPLSFRPAQQPYVVPADPEPEPPKKVKRTRTEADKERRRQRMRLKMRRTIPVEGEEEEETSSDSDYEDEEPVPKQTAPQGSVSEAIGQLKTEPPKPTVYTEWGEGLSGTQPGVAPPGTAPVPLPPNMVSTQPNLVLSSSNESIQGLSPALGIHGPSPGFISQGGQVGVQTPPFNATSMLGQRMLGPHGGMPGLPANMGGPPSRMNSPQVGMIPPGSVSGAPVVSMGGAQGGIGGPDGGMTPELVGRPPGMRMGGPPTSMTGPPGGMGGPGVIGGAPGGIGGPGVIGGAPGGIGGPGVIGGAPGGIGGPGVIGGAPGGLSGPGVIGGVPGGMGGPGVMGGAPGGIGGAPGVMGGPGGIGGAPGVMGGPGGIGGAPGVMGGPGGIGGAPGGMGGPGGIGGAPGGMGGPGGIGGAPGGIGGPGGAPGRINGPPGGAPGGMGGPGGIGGAPGGLGGPPGGMGGQGVAMGGPPGGMGVPPGSIQGPVGMGGPRPRMLSAKPPSLMDMNFGPDAGPRMMGAGSMDRGPQAMPEGLRGLGKTIEQASQPAPISGPEVWDQAMTHASPMDEPEEDFFPPVVSMYDPKKYKIDRRPNRGRGTDRGGGNDRGRGTNSRGRGGVDDKRLLDRGYAIPPPAPRGRGAPPNRPPFPHEMNTAGQFDDDGQFEGESFAFGAEPGEDVRGANGDQSGNVNRGGRNMPCGKDKRGGRGGIGRGRGGRGNRGRGHS